MTTAGLRLLLIVLVALLVGFVAGWRANITFGAESHRRYLPPVPATLAYETLGPTHLVGLHDYAYPVNVAMATAAPALTRSVKPSGYSGHVVSGVGQGRHRSVRLRGAAKWYADGPGLYAAAGPRLRAALGRHWRGQRVLVCRRLACVEVRLSDFCRCGSGAIIDLSPAAFRHLAPLSRGVVHVVVEGFRP